MVACLEKTEGNSDFHEIVDFLASRSIHHALTVSPPIYTSYIEQFWNTASSQTVNDVKQINATVDSKYYLNDQDANHEVVEDKGSGDKGGNAEELVSTARPEVSTARPDIDAARQEDSVVEPRTPPKITKIDPNSKGHWRYMKRSRRDGKGKERKTGGQDQASMDYIASLYDEVQDKMDASDEISCLELQMEEREMYTIEESYKESLKGKKSDSDIDEEEQLRASPHNIFAVEKKRLIMKFLGTRVHILALVIGNEIHMLAERRYPLIRETLERMMELRLTTQVYSVVSMANLEFVDQHNMVVCLEKTEGNSDFHEIVDFLASSSIHHALTEVVVTKASIISSLLFNDADGTACLTNEAMFQNLALMGYAGDFNKLTFQKALFSPQWKFLIHTILHCLSSKSTNWNEFHTNIASSVICLATNQKFNFSKLILDGMLRNLDNTKKKFLMYLRFLMVFLNNQIELGEPFNDVYPTPADNLKVFTNMSRKGLKFSGKITPLFPNMLTHAAEGEGSGEPTEPQPTPSPTQPSIGDQPPETPSSHATSQDSRDSLEGTNGNEGDQVQIPYDSPLSGGHTSDRAEGVLNLQELYVLCNNLSNRVLALESIKDAQAAKISAL
ncbi:hypothetical protein Tco_0824701 [Tanacetum coccineum]|uniref:Uncharacterized protein n=1 Tax=Tanacetum coccineum TaxID=301880 RepID=A0ABQ5API6_9ASTR